jgi:hypothetical protein
MAQEIINLIFVITGVIAAAGGFWAARAAHRSAVTAQKATERAERVDRRGLLRDLITTAHRVVSESIQVGSLTEELKTEYRALATFSGQSGGSKEKLFIHRAELKHKEVCSMKEEAQKLIEERTYLCNSSEEDFTQALSKFDGYLIHVLRIKDSLQREIATVAGDNRFHRGNLIRRVSQRI